MICALTLIIRARPPALTLGVPDETRGFPNPSASVSHSCLTATSADTSWSRLTG